MNASIRRRTWVSGGQERVAWQVTYPHKGRRVSRQFPTKREAVEFRTTVAWEVRVGRHTPRSKSITVDQAVDDWLARSAAKGLERQTVRTYSTIVEHHVRPILGPKKLADLDGPTLQQFADDLLSGAVPGGQPRSRIMVRKAVAMLSAILKEAKRKGLCAVNAAGDVQVERTRSEEDGGGHRELGVDVPTSAEIGAILAAASPRWRPMLLVASFCGLRASELRGLTWANVDLDAKVVKVRQRADRWGAMGPPKSKAGRREVPMPPLVLNGLREWRIACPPGELVFPREDGGVVDHSLIFRAFDAAQTKAGVLDPEGKAKYSVHALRRWAASYFIECGMSVKAVTTLMGHSSVAMSYDLYAGWLKDDEDVHAKLAAGALRVVGSGG